MLGKNVFLIGFSGSGKSSVGARLAQMLKWRFYDTDAIIEKSEERSITRIFEQSGERYFRSRETNLIGKLCKTGSPNAVIALGGGAFQTRTNRIRILRNGLVIFLSCAMPEIYKRLRGELDRPLMNVRLRNGESPRQARMRGIKNLLKQHAPNYRMAHIRFATTGKSIDTVVKELYHRIERYYAESECQTAGAQLPGSNRRRQHRTA